MPVYNRRPLIESDLLRAMKNTKSNAAAARYLDVHINTYKTYALKFKDENGVTFWDKHLNGGGKGIRRYHVNSKLTGVKLEDILNNKHPGYPLQKLKLKLIRDGIIKEKCENCGFEEKRVTDLQSPLLLTFREIPGDYSIENLEILCYNCAYLLIGNIIGRQKKVPAPPGQKNHKDFDNFKG